MNTVELLGFSVNARALGFYLLIFSTIGLMVVLRFCWELFILTRYGCSYVWWQMALAGQGSATHWFFKDHQKTFPEKLKAMWNAFLHIILTMPTEVESAGNIWRGPGDWKIGSKKSPKFTR